MTCFDTENLSDIFEIIHVANAHLQIDSLRRETLKVMHRTLRSDTCNFFLTDSKSRLVNPIAINLEQRYLKLYESHFHRFNPYDKKYLRQSLATALADEHVVSLPDFLKSEYFNDFLQPQEIHHQMCIYIRNNKEMVGAIGLHRRKEHGEFSETELMIGKLVAPHLALAIEKARLFVKITENGDFYRTICDCNAVGMAIFNEKIQPVYLNKKAVEMCDRMRRSGMFFDERGLERFPLPAQCYEDCVSLRYQRENPSTSCGPLVRHRTVIYSPTEKYLIRCQVLDENLTDFGAVLFLFTIEDVSESQKLDRTRLHEGHGLTKREMEIVGHIIKGSTNSEISETLYISEGTVKNHLKSIFDKMGVRNRTSLIHKVLFP